MAQIEEAVWNGSVNAQFKLPPVLTVQDVRDPVCHVQLNRESYLPCLLGGILARLQQYMNCLPETVMGQLWVEYDGRPLTWSLPVGVLYDMCQANVILDRSAEGPQRDHIEVWSLQICCSGSSDMPLNVIPVLDNSDDTFRSIWMHSWKQSCYILNGNARKMMSLARHESQLFWGSIYSRDRNQFRDIARKIVPSNLQKIPIKVHNATNDEELMPLVSIGNRMDYTVEQLVKEHLNKLLTTDTAGLKGLLVAQGIVLKPDDDLNQLFRNLLSIDGWLHITII